jgi:hypothetical protein
MSGVLCWRLDSDGLAKPRILLRVGVGFQGLFSQHTILPLLLLRMHGLLLGHLTRICHCVDLPMSQ